MHCAFLFTFLPISILLFVFFAHSMVFLLARKYFLKKYFLSIFLSVVSAKLERGERNAAKF